jgi:hypothetical protein
MIMGSSSDINGKKDMVGGVAGPESVPEPAQMHKNKGPVNHVAWNVLQRKLMPGLASSRCRFQKSLLKRGVQYTADLRPRMLGFLGLGSSTAFRIARTRSGPSGLSRFEKTEKGNQKAGADLGPSDDEQYWAFEVCQAPRQDPW